jgi:peptidoglycan L-alanyl-D-glutamate endopeptidase CwlK
MYTFGERSMAELNTCHPDLIRIATEAIKICPVDFGISDGNRSIEQQQQYFKEGKSKLDGINKKSKHNYNPSLAFDFYAFVDGKLTYNQKHMSMIAGCILAVANQLGIEITWGGLWKGFVDMPHIELKSNS